MEKIKIVYDNWCPNCIRFTKLVKKLDWLNLVDVAQLRNLPPTLEPDISKATKAMAGYFHNRWNYGYTTIHQIMLRIPLIWPFLPILWLFSITGLGERLYNELSVRRNIIPIHCDDNCHI